MSGRRAGWRLYPALLAACVLALAPASARPETATDSGGPPTGALAAVARLDFVLNIGKFLFFRVGTGAYPTASSTIDTVSFAVVPSIPAAPTVPGASGSNVIAPWDGTAPSFGFTSSNNVLPVDVRSNDGQISIAATVTSALVSGANSIPMSEITITSSDANLPAPLIPNAGVGAAVNVAGTAFANLVTIRSANWTFAYNPVTIPAPGTYTGQVSFTASSP